MELTLVEGDNNTLELNETTNVIELNQPADAEIEILVTSTEVIEVAFTGGGGGGGGTPGQDGRGIESIVLLSGNHAPGTLDTYRITYTDDTTFDFQVYNGEDGEGGSGGTVPDATETVKGIVELATLAEHAAGEDPSRVVTVVGLKQETDAAKNRANHTGTQSADTLTDGSTNRLFSSAEKTKLSGIATGATANATNAQLRDRSTHTGTQTSSTISDFAEAAQDAVAAMLQGASGVTLSYDDAANTLTITGPGAGGLDAEAVRDAIGVALIGAGNISVAVNDAADTITISTTATVNDTDANLKNRANHTGSQATSTITGLDSALGNRVRGNFDLVTIGKAAYDALSSRPATTIYIVTGP